MFFSVSTFHPQLVHSSRTISPKDSICFPRCDVLEVVDDKATTNPDVLPVENQSVNESQEKTRENKKNDDDDGEQLDPRKASEASANKLEMFQEKQKFIEEQNRKRKEMLSKVNPKLRDFFCCRLLSMSLRQFWTGKSRLTRRAGSCK